MLCGEEVLSHRHSFGEYEIRTCQACGLSQLDPLPSTETTINLYADGYFAGTGAIGYSDYADQEREYRATFAEDLRSLSPYLAAGASALDVGCGFGWFVHGALAAGYDAIGIDFSREAVERAAQILPGRVFHGAINDVAELRDRRFDLIFSSHVIEHIPEPHVFMADLVDRLNEGGVIALVTPNIESALARISGRRWVSFKLPEHVSYYSPSTIRRLLETAGLEVVSVEPAYQYYALPFLMHRIRELIHPIGKLIPRIESSALLRNRMVRVTSGSLRVIARRPVSSPGPLFDLDRAELAL